MMLDVLEHPETRFSGNAAEKRNQLLLTSLRAAYEEMERLEGPDAKQWNWGKLQYNLSEHPFSAIVDDATRSRINVGPIEKNGSPFVPNASGYRSRDFRQMSGPSVRVVVDVGNWDNSRAVNHPGQSGDPDSPHYRDLARRCGATASTSLCSTAGQRSRMQPRKRSSSSLAPCGNRKMKTFPGNVFVKGTTFRSYIKHCKQIRL
jgi:hypothetical protein